MHAFLGGVVLLSAFARRHHCFFYFSGLALFLFAALRYGFGNDYFSYYQCFLDIRLMGQDPFPGEGLFTFFNRALPHFYWLIALTSLVFVGTLWRFMRNSLPDEWLWFAALILLMNPYLFLMHLSAIRQSMALVCFICAVPFACRRKPVPFCLLILAACGFHQSAILLFPVYFIIRYTPVSRGATIALALSVTAVLYLGYRVNEMLASSLNLLQLTQYGYALQSDLRNSLRATLLSSVTFFYLLGNLPRLHGKTLVYAKLWMVGSMFSVLAYQISMFTRVEMYFDVFSIVAFPRMLARPQKDKRLYAILNNLVFPALILTILFLRYYSFFTNPMWEPFTTYRTILSN